MNHLDELLQHLLGDGEIGDHTVLHRANRLDVAGHLAEHLLGFLADRLDRALAVGAAFLPDRNHRRFIEHNAFAAHVDQRVGGAKVDCKIVGKVTAKKTEHE